MDNLQIYNKVRTVPAEAQKEIKGGRLSGYTDINPMWRIKTLTEQFGVCGFGWKYTITDKRLEKGANEEIAAFVDIDLCIKVDGEWSEPIPGTGGSTFVANERNGMYTSDECFKMALTDALSVACKALGIGADVYWKEGSKYLTTGEPTPPPQAPSQPQAGEPAKCTKEQIAEIFRLGKEKTKNMPDFDIFTFIDRMAAEKSISNKFPYGNKEKTIINWTVQDYETLKTQLELPF